MVTIEELIIETMPFSEALKDQIKKDTEFLKALKITNYKRFISLGAVSLSYSPIAIEDEIIGVYTFVYKLKIPKFKQDFIVNKGKKDINFILYTRFPEGSKSKKVKDINEFYTIYSKDIYYVNTHHIKYEELPNSLKQRGLEAIKLAEKLKSGYLAPLKNAELNKFEQEINVILGNNK